MKSYPPAAEMSPDDMLELCAEVGRVPALSYDLAGSREHIEAVCRLVVDLHEVLEGEKVQIRERTQERDTLQRHIDVIGPERFDAEVGRAAAERDNRALQLQVAALTNRNDRLATGMSEAMAALDDARKVAAAAVGDGAVRRWEETLRSERQARELHAEAARERDRLVTDLAAARQAIADREDEIARVNNLRQAEVNEAAEQRQRADNAEAAAEIFEMTARSALAIIDRTGAVTLAEVVKAVDGRLARALVREQAISAAFSAKLEEALRRLEDSQQTHALNDALRGATLAITGKTIEEVNIQLDAELAAHPDLGPLHHARDQREQDGGP